MCPKMFYIWDGMGFISEMVYVPILEWQWLSSKLMVSITSGVSLWYRPSHNVNLWQRQQMPQTYDNLKVHLIWL